MWDCHPAGKPEIEWFDGEGCSNDADPEPEDERQFSI